MSKKIFHLLSLLLLGNVMVACSSTKAPDMSDASTVMNTDSSAVVSVASEVAVSSEVVVASAPVSDNVNIHNHNSVYYGFNKYDIQDPYKAIVEANAAYIRSNKSAAVQVQGNTDDIGSVEYNLALGQKRADSVKKALIASGPQL